MHKFETPLLLVILATLAVYITAPILAAVLTVAIKMAGF